MSIIAIKYGQVDPEAKADAKFKAVDQQDWADINDLGLDDINVRKVATLEHNYTLLDGSFEEFPNNPEDFQWAWWTKSSSDSYGVFEVPPMLEVEFTQNHKSKGLTFVTNARSLKVTWFNLVGGILHSDVYEFDGDEDTVREVVIREPIENYGGVEIKILATNNPYRYGRLHVLDYGIVYLIDDAEINTANILEEDDPISDTLSINTLNFQWKTKEPVFNPVSGDPSDDMLMKKQYLYVMRDEKFFGAFFLEGWKDPFNTGNTFNFKAIDAIGVLDKYKFMGGLYEDIPAIDVVQEIFDLVFPTRLVKFKWDEALNGKTIRGYIPICTCREALQFICFAIGAVADTSRRRYVWIYPRDTEIHFDNIPKEKLYVGGNIEPTPYYSGLNMKFYAFARNNDGVEAFKGILPIGTHQIEFSEPLWGLSITGGTIIESDVNYAIISVVQQGEVFVKGYSHTQSEAIHPIREEIIAGEVESLAIFENCTLMNADNVKEIAESVFVYLKQRLSIENDARLEELEVGYVAKMETYGRPIIGTIERMEINLRGGRAKTRIIGNIGGD